MCMCYDLYQSSPPTCPSPASAPDKICTFTWLPFKMCHLRFGNNVCSVCFCAVKEI